MDTITKIRNKARAKLKTIALPEYDDSRIVEAARIIEAEGIAKVLLLTADKINPQDKEKYIQEFYQMRKAKGLSRSLAQGRDLDINTVRKMFDSPLYYAAMMTWEGKIDGFVAGASHTTPDIARAALYCLGVEDRIGIMCSCFIMVVPNCAYGEAGTFVFADCGIIPDPNPRQLASIAVTAAELAQKVLDITPRVALLSYSTRDAAIVPEVAKIKYPDSQIGGRANVLIFPNLEAGNISYKLVQRLAQARALGPLLLGLNKPCSDLSRGCLVKDVVDCVAVTAIRAQ